MNWGCKISAVVHSLLFLQIRVLSADGRIRRVTRWNDAFSEESREIWTRMGHIWSHQFVLRSTRHLDRSKIPTTCAVDWFSPVACHFPVTTIDFYVLLLALQSILGPVPASTARLLPLTFHFWTMVWRNAVRDQFFYGRNRWIEERILRSASKTLILNLRFQMVSVNHVRFFQSVRRGELLYRQFRIHTQFWHKHSLLHSRR